MAVATAQDKSILHRLNDVIVINRHAAITAAPVNASVAHALNATFSDTEAEAALNALGTKINLVGAAVNTIIDILENLGAAVPN